MTLFSTPNLCALALGTALTATLVPVSQEPAWSAEPFDGDCIKDPDQNLPPTLVLSDFKTASSQVSGDEAAEIETFADEVAHLSKICVMGQADKRGPSAYNDRLAMARARAVAAHLIGAGVDPRRLSIASRAEAGGDLFPDWFWFAGSRRVDVIPVR